MCAGFEVVQQEGIEPSYFLYGNPLACGMFVLSRRLQYKRECIPTQDAGFANANANRAAILGNKVKLGFCGAGFEVVRSTKKKIGTHKECLSLFW